MSIDPNVTQQNLNNLGEVVEKPKNQWAVKIRNRILKQT